MNDPYIPSFLAPELAGSQKADKISDSPLVLEILKQRSEFLESAIKYLKEASRKNLEQSESATKPDHITLGSAVGKLDVINIHNPDQLLFRIYPEIGADFIDGCFNAELYESVLAGLNKFVRIAGEIHYKHGEKFPYFIKAQAINILPDQDNPQLLLSLRGMAKDAYGGLAATDYVEKIRNEAW